MSDIALSNFTPTDRTAATGVAGRGRASARIAPSAPRARGADQADISDEARAQFLSRLKELPPVRQDLIDNIRQQIQAGTYDTPERLSGSLDGLLQDLDAHP
jgi:anti-sigma28 factor (negative regulator of flagellin synthesis)